MLRCVAFSLFGLVLVAGAADAREGGGGGRRAAEDRAERQGAPLLRKVVFTRPAVAPAAACAKGARDPALRCRGNPVPDSGRGWARGLPAALGVQAQECPADTVATLAAGHQDIVRCLPF